MLERMREILERIEEINQSFRAFAPKRIKQNKNTFQKAITDALNNTKKPLLQNSSNDNDINLQNNNNDKTNSKSQSTTLKNSNHKPKSQLPLFQTVSPLVLQQMTNLQSNLENNIFNKNKNSFNYNPSIYQELINKYASQNNLDPNLIKRIIEVESNYNPYAVSKKGAMGLMQIMPETAKDLNVENPFDPEQNIAAGTKYLSLLLKQYNGDLAKALAAYNAGPSIVNYYNGVPPFKETQDYVQKILSSKSYK